MRFASNIRFALSSLIQTIKRPSRLKKLRTFIRHEKEAVRQVLNGESRQEKKGTLVIKCDDIGDFLMWQQVIPVIAEHAEKPVYFVGNLHNRPLVETFFDFADQYIWIDKSRWNDPVYRNSQYKLMHSLHAKTAFTTLFTRNPGMDDMLLLASAATERVAWDMSHHTYFPELSGDLKEVTTRTVSSPVKTELEYFRNITFVNTLYKANIPREFKALFPHFKKQKRLVVVPMASAASKCWKPEYLIRVIREVVPLFDSVLLVGGKDAEKVSEQIEKSVNSPKLINLSGQTMMNELVVFIGESSLLLTPDTFALHAGVLTATDTILLTNGTNWQRYMDYAPYIQSRLQVIFPPDFKKDPAKVKLVYSRSEINTIQPGTVIDAVKLMSGK